MSENKELPLSDSPRPQPLTEEKGLRPTNDPPKMPPVKPPKPEEDR